MAHDPALPEPTTGRTEPIDPAAPGPHREERRPTPLRIDLGTGRAAFREALDAFGAAAESLGDLELLAPSRCRGWNRLDCLVHVRVGLEEMLTGPTASTEATADVDAASYWSTSESEAAEDPVPGILWTRRTADAYARPRDALEHLGRVIAALRLRSAELEPGVLDFQGHRIEVGDFLATWAVELVVHHLDLDLPPGSPPPSPEALRLARVTAEALTGPSTPEALDAQVVLEGFGRR